MSLDFYYGEEIKETAQQVFAGFLQVVSGNSVMPRLVTADNSLEVAKQGDTVTVSDVEDLSVVSYVANSGFAPQEAKVLNRQVSLDHYKSVPVYLDDKGLAAANKGVIAQAFRRAALALAEYIDKTILELSLAVPAHVGTAGTSPFSAGVAPVVAANVKLNEANAVKADRFCVLNSQNTGDALATSQFTTRDYGADDSALREAQLGRLGGFDFFDDNFVEQHTLNSGVTGFTSRATASLKDQHRLELNKTADDILAVGDLFTIAGQSTQYVIRAVNDKIIDVHPFLSVDVPANTALTFVATHNLGLAFQRDAIRLITRSTGQDAQTLPGTGARGRYVETWVDPLTGVPFTLNVYDEPQLRRTVFAFDVLFGVGLVRPDWAVRVLS